MKKIVYIFSLSSLISIQVCGFYNPFSSTINGAATYSDKTFDKTLTVNGYFIGTKLQAEDLIVHGAAEIQDSTINGRLDVSGSVTIENSTIKEKAVIKGSIIAQKVCFQDTVEASGLVELIDSNAKDISVKGRKKGKVILEGNTTVGTIHFRSGKGKVIISKNATVTGIVRGGIVEKQEEPESLFGSLSTSSIPRRSGNNDGIGLGTDGKKK